jgi:NAD(P)-dependent dehydrogenase (short-subunit alcohol dehydrogenase family)
VQTRILRDGLLAGKRVVVAGPPDNGGASPGSAALELCARLGAAVGECRPDRLALSADDERPTAEAAAAALAAVGGVPHTLVIDCAALFDAPGALAMCMQGTWALVRALAAEEMLVEGGRVLLLAPAPGAGEQAGAARAALENLARTLSVEWARYGVTAVCVAPADATSAEEAATLVAYLASRAGAYFSGCVLEMTGS